MRQEFRLQDPGEGIAEVEVQEVLVAEGDPIEEGDEVLVVESDKAAIELPSPYTGKVTELHVSEGDTVSVGAVLLVVETEGEGAERSEARRPAGETDANSRDTPGDKNGERTGDRARGEDEAEAGTDGAAVRARQDDDAVRASPAARSRASAVGLDLAGIDATGPDGEVTVDDVERAISRNDTAAGQSREAGKKDEPGPSQEEALGEAGSSGEDNFGPVERVPLRSIRAATARAMTRAWSEIPHVVHQDMADITELERWRRRVVDEERDENLTLTPIIVKAVVGVLRRHPRFNAIFDAEASEIVLRRYYNVNVAVATSRGLITPVLRDADRKPIRALALELAELAEVMRKGRPTKEALTGGTFTITNVGGLGGMAFSPLINPPQTAILGLARARLTPVVSGDLEDLGNAETRIRLMLPLIVAFDHRVVDGADAAAFINDLAEILGDAKRLALDA
ncbi:2-oxo acid dehydrogenase subunit E2 [Limibaculum sp. M0105]|uniref:Dihydrolipoamide acetyltransferase component of pyruvate dehydrogenase complex n=1 Tax=Thermohalobaculum xanthum TaxID=2753746 RepID=A0A8J7SGG2_9RHOB|nr:dihydrolipoamide acetyltransferase family protein [Thermohalobaculum xanthum]MBK0400152.1 2-oxo acid dehydrogenase subunit E2 [Thermohalobaculum xanthum]